MAKVLSCTGKKNKVAAVMNLFKKLDQQKRIEILGRKLKTKRALIWSYEELKILFNGSGGKELVPEALARSLDLLQVKEQAVVVVSFSSPQVEDPLLKTNILRLSGPYLRQHVTVKNLKQEEIRHNEYRIERKCTAQIIGPAKSVIAYKDALVKENLCDPKSVTYVF